MNISLFYKYQQFCFVMVNNYFMNCSDHPSTNLAKVSSARCPSWMNYSWLMDWCIIRYFNDHVKVPDIWVWLLMVTRWLIQYQDVVYQYNDSYYKMTLLWDHLSFIMGNTYHLFNWSDLPFNSTISLTFRIEGNQSFVVQLLVLSTAVFIFKSDNLEIA